MLRTATSQLAKTVLAVSLCAGLGLATDAVSARASSTTGRAAITVAQLPGQGQQTYRLIHQGGPFPFEKDGVVFGNRERLLPVMRRGYYREYTVGTAGVRHRGARRIVCGGQVPARPDACYYTSDHYSSFRKIVEQ